MCATSEINWYEIDTKIRAAAAAYFLLNSISHNVICHEMCNTESGLRTCKVYTCIYISIYIYIWVFLGIWGWNCPGSRTPFSGFPLFLPPPPPPHRLAHFPDFPQWRWQMINVWSRQLCIFLHNRKTFIPIKQRGVVKIYTYMLWVAGYPLTLLIFIYSLWFHISFLFQIFNFQAITFCSVDYFYLILFAVSRKYSIAF